jgi:hypothetical protein
LEIATAEGWNFTACSANSWKLSLADKPTTWNRSELLWTISKQFLPMEPVEPKIMIFFIIFEPLKLNEIAEDVENSLL